MIFVLDQALKSSLHGLQSMAESLTNTFLAEKNQV